MLKKRIITNSFTFISLVYFEVITRIFTTAHFDARFFYSVAFCIPMAGVFFILTLFKNHIAFKIAYNSLIGLLTLFYCIQSVYYKVFAGYCGAVQLFGGGDAVTNFASQTAAAVIASLIALLLLILPLVASILLTVFKVLTFEKAPLKFSLISAGAVAVLHALCIILLTISGTGRFSPFGSYCSLSSPIDSMAQNFGCFSAFRRDCENLVLKAVGFEDDRDSLKGIDDTLANKEYSPEEYNVISFDQEEFIEISNDISAKIGQITEAVLSREPTAKNEYTGMFESYNLITICAESFSPYVIDKDLTPTLYKLSTEGFVFENYYGSFESLTTNGEYTFHTGMFPDFSRYRTFRDSQNNAFPFVLGNMFSSVGIDTYAYHNYLGTYFDRYLSHPNLGYDVFKTPDAGLNVDLDWPSSDYEMMVESVDDYISSGEQFHTYYMTFSGHYQYDWENPMARKNKDAVSHLDYSEAVKAYLACNLELEYALTYLLERLEEEGIADKTVIALSNDHYPYGLTVDEYCELAGKDVDRDFEKYHNSFILWTGSMDTPVKVDKLCSTIDVLPTLLNLFGFEYDSRFVMGRDILSDSEGIAIFANEGFITESYKFDAKNNVILSLTDGDVDMDAFEKTQDYVSRVFALSKMILNTDYYSYLTDYLEGALTAENADDVEDTILQDEVTTPPKEPVERPPKEPNKRPSKK